MTPKPTKPGSQKKNKGGRPRKHAKSGTPGSTAITWKKVSSPPGGTNDYEVNNQGQVRRKLKNGEYRDVKAWGTGGPYAAVYLYGYPNVTRNRKKVYVHRLVAEHFVKGRKPNEVVHHKQGPANNTASQLEWVSIEENAKARKYFNSDGTRRKKVTDRVQKANALKNKGTPSQSEAKPKASDLAPAKIPPKAKKQKPVKPANPDNEPAKIAGDMEKLPGHDVFIPKTESLRGKIIYLAKVSKEFKRAFMDTKTVHPKLKLSNFAEYFKKATGKGLKLSDKKGAQGWKTKLLSALHAIKTRLPS